ncbi:MAG: toll/interleukin-1 receptor domain-containing protein [Alphaproteobacteria bacterium]|nr:toll/interleukin-1 receptor domain-containing protein [Alphaproteobacteria bacterium]
MTEAPRNTNKLEVFVSYSRDDLAFADQLDSALKLTGFSPTIDRHGISAGEDWKRRLGNLIRDADTVVFVLSPSSAVSDTCAWEVDEAVRLGKRIIPVLCRPLEDTKPPPQLADLNYIYFYAEPKSPDSGFGTGLKRLVTALNTDLEWLRDHTRYMQRATEWDVGGRPVNRLLSGADIGIAKAWAARRPKDAPAPTPLHMDFIKASEAEEDRRQSAEEQRLAQIAEAQAAREAALTEKDAAQKSEAEHARRVVQRTRLGLAAA